MRNLVFSGLCCLIFFASSYADDLEQYDFFGDITDKFQVQGDTCELFYHVSYYFLGIRFFNLADAELKYSRGLWAHNGNGIPAYMLDIAIYTDNLDKEPEKSRLYMNNRLLSVVSVSNTTTLVYAKQTDEHVNPFFGKRRRYKTSHCYAMGHDCLTFTKVDYLTGTVSTNLEGNIDTASQAEKVSRFLQIISDLYSSNDDDKGDGSLTIDINFEGQAIPFLVETEHTDAPTHFMDKDWPSLKVEVEPAPGDHEIKDRRFAMWTVSIADFAKMTGDEKLLKMKDRLPSWGMVPLAADYDMIWGFVRCSLDELKVVGEKAVK